VDRNDPHSPLTTHHSPFLQEDRELPKDSLPAEKSHSKRALNSVTLLFL
jgi:hypothetical protein